MLRQHWGSKSEDSKLITCVITFQVTQPIRPRTVYTVMIDHKKRDGRRIKILNTVARYFYK